MMDFPSGPALDEEEAQALAVLMRDSNWAHFDALLKRMWTAADQNLNKLDRTPEVNGYWKGVKAITRDLREMPAKIGKQLFEQQK